MTSQEPNPMETVRAVFIDATNKKVTDVDIPRDFLTKMYELIGCDCVTIGEEFPNGDMVFVDDAGLLKKPTKYFLFSTRGYKYAGNGMILGAENEDGQITDAKTRAEYLGMFYVDLDEQRSIAVPAEIHSKQEVQQ